MEPCVSKNQKGIYVGLIRIKILKKAAAMEKSIPELKAEFACMCVREKITALKFMQSFQGI